jgi:hypothetical protein
LNIDKVVTGYFRKNHKMINGAIEVGSLKFRTKLQEIKSKKGLTLSSCTTPGTLSKQTHEEYYDEEYEDEMEIQK